MQVLFRPGSGGLIRDLPPDRFRAALRDPRALLWVDLDVSEREMTRLVLSEAFSFHPLAVEDVLTQASATRIDDYNEYVFLVIHGVAAGERAEEIPLGKLDIFLGQNYLVTCRTAELPAVQSLFDQACQDESVMAGGAAHLLYLVLRDLALGFTPPIEELAQEIKRMEAAITGRQDPRALQGVVTLRRQTVQLRSTLVPQREVAGRLAYDDLAPIPVRARPYFRDVYDHLGGLVTAVERLRELVDGVVNLYMAAAAGRMAMWLRVLTLAVVLLLPMLVIATAYGVLVVYRAGQGRWYGALLVWVLMAGVAYGIWHQLRRRGWW